MAGSYPPGPTPASSRHRDGHRARSTAARLTMSVTTLVSIVLLVAAGYAWYVYRDINNGVPRLNVAVDQPPADRSGKDIDGKAQNILLVGNDDRTNMTDAEVNALHVGRDGGSMSTDTMMIVHVPADGAKATLISLPRDSYVAIPGNSMNKLNAAYVDGYNAAGGTVDQKRTAGANLLVQTVQNLTGLTINHYVQVSLLGFYEISQAIGGVPIDLCNSVDDSYSGFDMSAGKHVISGVQALEFVRQRHGLPNGDLDRVRRQQYFLTSAFRQVASVGIVFKLQALGDAIKRSLFMDKGMDLTSLATQMSNLSANNIVGVTIPFERFDDNTPVGSVEIVDPASVQAFVDNVINPPAASPTPTPTAPATPVSSPSSSASATAAPDAQCVN